MGRRWDAGRELVLLPVDILEGFLLRSPESGLKFQAAFPPIGADADQAHRVAMGAAHRLSAYCICCRPS